MFRGGSLLAPAVDHFAASTAVSRHIGGEVMPQWIASPADLEVLGLDTTAHHVSVSRYISVACIFGLLCVVTCWIQLSASTATCVSVILSSFAYALSLHPARTVKREADKIRRQLDLSTAVFLDLVNVMIAGGAGIETSVLAASNSGAGPGFSLIRLAVMRAQSARVSYWDSLADLGRQVNVASLVEVAHTVQLAGQHGARVRESLAAKAEALRKKNLARVEFEEEQRTEKIGLPLVVLFLGFLVLIGYPAFVQTVTSL